MTKSEIACIRKKLDEHMKAVAKERDAISSYIYELQGLKDSCDRAYDSLWDARDALSEFV